MSHSSEISHPSSDVDSDVLIKVDNVSKKFCRDFKKSLWYGLKDTAADILHPKHKSADSSLRPSEFWANQDISFEVKRGECLGLIGCNGAGKTTLLKMLNGLMKPDTGSIEMYGRVGALIALGAGFNPILTGRENIYVNGSILGLHKKEIDAKLDEIVDFAEMEDAIDAPVRTYSSGMQVRLGFAVASTMDPDVLIIDEVLAVGDSAFKVACYNRIRDLLPTTAVIFVSHNMFDVSRVSTDVMVLENGRSTFSGDRDVGIHVYNELNSATVENKGGLSKMVIHRDKMITNLANVQYTYDTRDLDTSIKLSFDVSSIENLGSVRVRLVFFDETETSVAEWDSYYHDDDFVIPKGNSTLSIVAARIRLMSGHYRVAVVVTNPENHGYFAGIEYGIKLALKNRAAGGPRYKI